MPKKNSLICFDLDDTIIPMNSWYEINTALGLTPEEDRTLSGEFKNNIITAADWAQKITTMFKDRGKAHVDNIKTIISKFEVKDDAYDTLKYLKHKGYRIALISGSVDVVVDLVAKKLEIEMAEATNRFIFNQKGWLENVVTLGDDKVAKLNCLNGFCRKLGIETTEAYCVGDGSNDIEMFRSTNKGITFKGSPIEDIAWKTINNLSELKDIF